MYGFTWQIHGVHNEGLNSPLLTTGVDKDKYSIKLVTIAIQCLCNMSSMIDEAFSEACIMPNERHNRKFASKVGRNYGLRARDSNIFEGIDMALVSLEGDEILHLHCNEEHIFSPDYNLIAVTKKQLQHKRFGHVSISATAYSRVGIHYYMQRLHFVEDIEHRW